MCIAAQTPQRNNLYLIKSHLTTKQFQEGRKFLIGDAERYETDDLFYLHETHYCILAYDFKRMILIPE